MNTFNFLDANGCPVLLWSRHAHSGKARTGFEQVREEESFLPFHLDHRSKASDAEDLGQGPKCMSEASDLWDRIWADNCVVLFAAPEDIDKEFRSKSRLSS